MSQEERTLTCDVGIMEGVQAHRDRAPHGGPLDGSAYPLARHAGRVVPRWLPPPGLPDLSNPDRWLDHLPRPTHHQRGLAGHRPGRQAPPRHRLRRLPLRRLGVGRLGPRPGDLDSHPLDPRRRDRDRGRRHPLSQAWRQGRLRWHLPRRGALVEAAQDPAVRAELGRPGHRRADPVPHRPLLLPAGALAALPQEGTGRLPDPSPGGRGAGVEAGRGQSRADVLAGRRQCLRQRGGVAGSTEEPPGDRTVALEGGAATACPPRAGPGRRGHRARKGIVSPTPRP